MVQVGLMGSGGVLCVRWVLFFYVHEVMVLSYLLRLGYSEKKSYICSVSKFSVYEEVESTIV